MKNKKLNKKNVLANKVKKPRKVFDYSKLHGRIIEKYGLLTTFAKEMGITVSTVSKVIKTGAGLTNSTIVDWCNALNIDSESIGIYFYTLKSQSIE